MSSYQLIELQTRFHKAVAQIEADFLAGANGNRRMQVVVSERCLIFLQDSYGRFVRDLLLRSAVGNSETSSGTLLSPGRHGAVRHSALLGHLRSQWAAKPKPNYWEPSWYLTGDWTKVIRLLQPQNSGVISAALGSNANPADEMRLIRNFVVHRGPASAARMQTVGVVKATPGWHQPCDVMMSGGQPSIFLTWCHRLRSISVAATQ